MSLNLVDNPSFEADTSGWTPTRGTITRDVTEFHFGSASCRYDSDTLVTGSRFAQFKTMPVLARKKYTASSYIWLGSTFTDGQVQINWRSASGFLSSDLGSLVPISTSHTRVDVIAAAPDEAVEATVAIAFRPDPTITAATAFFDGIMFNEGELIEYLEGEGSLIDQMMAALIAEGFTKGSVSDREYDRLLAKTLESEDNSISDLYELAGESPRITGKLRK